MLKRVEASGRRVGKPVGIFLAIVLCGFLSLSPASAAVLDPPFEIPPGDPGEQTGPFIGLQYAGDNLVVCVGPNDPIGCNPDLTPADRKSVV